MRLARSFIVRWNFHIAPETAFRISFLSLTSLGRLLTFKRFSQSEEVSLCFSITESIENFCMQNLCKVLLQKRHYLETHFLWLPWLETSIGRSNGGPFSRAVSGEREVDEAGAEAALNSSNSNPHLKA